MPERPPAPRPPPPRPPPPKWVDERLGAGDLLIAAVAILIGVAVVAAILSR